jgi:hypothetical protein
MIRFQTVGSVAIGMLGAAGVVSCGVFTTILTGFTLQSIICRKNSPKLWDLEGHELKRLSEKGIGPLAAITAGCGVLTALSYKVSEAAFRNVF